MRQLKTMLAPVLIACLAALLAAGPAFAVPPPPSIFHGAITFEGQNAPDGIPILALIEGAQYATSYVQMDQGNSVYTLEVPGDDPDTPEREGGREGDTIQFELPGWPADQTGIWHSGANVLLNLTVFIVGPPATPTPSPTPSPMPTETSRPIVQPSPTPTGIPVLANPPLPTPSRTATPPVQPSPTGTASPTPPWTPTWTPTGQPAQASLPSPAPTLTLVSTRLPSPTTMSSLASTPGQSQGSTPGQSQGQRGTPITSGQSSPDITPSATAVQTVRPVEQPPVTSVSLPTVTRTAIPPAQLRPLPAVPLSSETSDSSTRLEGILLVAAALVMALVTCLAIAASVVIRHIRQPR